MRAKFSRKTVPASASRQPFNSYWRRNIRTRRQDRNTGERARRSRSSAERPGPIRRRLSAGSRCGLVFLRTRTTARPLYRCRREAFGRLFAWSGFRFSATALQALAQCGQFIGTDSSRAYVVPLRGWEPRGRSTALPPMWSDIARIPRRRTDDGDPRPVREHFGWRGGRRWSFFIKADQNTH